MRTTLAAITGLLTVVVLEATGAEPQPSISQIAATVTQLGPGWTSNRVVVLLDRLSSPSEMADKNENPDVWLKFARNLMSKDPRRDAHAILGHYPLIA